MVPCLCHPQSVARGTRGPEYVLVRRWSEQERTALRRDYLSGVSISGMASQLRRSESSVANELHRQRRADHEIGRRTRPWTDSEDRLLLDSLSERVSVPQLALRLQRSEAAVVERHRQLSRVERRPGWSPIEDAKLVSLFEAGDTHAEIASALDRSPGQVAGRLDVLRRQGASIGVRKPRWTGAQRERLAAMYRGGTTLRALEQEFGRSRGTITSQLRTLRSLGYDLSRSTRPRRR